MAAETHEPALTPAEATRLFEAVIGADARGLALAVSGGADSVALMRLAAEWRARARPALPVAVLSVDHGLRSGSEREVGQVRQWAAGFGLHHETLRWEGGKPESGIHEAARAARYALLCGRCTALGLTHLALAHHLDDQAETVLMRMLRGSGIDGLAGMAAEVERAGVRVVRPLLCVPKARLVATLRALRQDWIEDPSNADPRFARARLRRIAPLLAAEGLDARALARLAGRMARARRALDAQTALLRDAAVTVDAEGAHAIDGARLGAAVDETGIRLLGAVIAAAGGGAVVRLERLEALHRRLASALRGGSGFHASTLGGCRISLSGATVRVSREPPRRRGAARAAAVKIDSIAGGGDCWQ